MDPIYFGSRLTAYEAAAYVRGLARRRRASWEQARYVAFYAAKPHCKEGFTFESMGKFPWEDCADDIEELNKNWEDEVTRLRERAIARDKLIGSTDEDLFNINNW